MASCRSLHIHTHDATVRRCGDEQQHRWHFMTLTCRYGEHADWLLESSSSSWRSSPPWSHLDRRKERQVSVKRTEQLTACVTAMLTLQVPVLVLRFGESRVLVEQCSYKGHVELRVPTHDVGGRHKLSAAKAISLLQHTLGSLRQVLLLVAQTQIQNILHTGSTFSYDPSPQYISFLFQKHIWKQIELSIFT